MLVKRAMTHIERQMPNNFTQNNNYKLLLQIMSLPDDIKVMIFIAE